MESFYTEKGVHPIGPYSQVIKANGFVFLAGQVPTNPKAEPVGKTVAEKTHKMCQNAAAVLEAAGSSMDKVVKVTVYFADLNDFDEVNKVFGKYFPSKPARTSVQVARLPLDLALEMDVTAIA
ncbi:hypothetical protein H2198_006834 [Neophaeococcomyces mojaviensis]|uniref:Uncharacterized protein n=1 Tax=Neophaeococcomyces mojaviensis TaxID=3383035 RepID=A0ACC3A1W2_9EURO|nr:hypothetical protein H2198_006834 [Knufia sp. JES_112]